MNLNTLYIRSTLFISIVSLFMLCSGIYLLETSFSTEMVFSSISLFIILTAVFIFEKEKLTPLLFFSVLFFGYVFSGLYFSIYNNIANAKFFSFTGDYTTTDLANALFKVVVGYIFFLIGYKVSDSLNIKKKGFKVSEELSKNRFVKYFLITLFTLSFTYWIFASYRLAGNPYNLIKNMGQYHLLQEANYTSTAPYILAYSASTILFLLSLSKARKLNVTIISMISLSFIMYVSTGRLAGSVTYLLSFPLMYMLHFNKKIEFKHITFFSLFALLIGSLYFFRLYSNLLYLNQVFDTDIIDMIGVHFFGMTNVGDLQSITYSTSLINSENLLLGHSFLDFSEYWISKLLGVGDCCRSVGTRLTDYYFSGFDSGSPAPGVISEMIINFGMLGVTFGMSILGFVVALLYKAIVLKSIVGTFLKAQFLIFIMLLSKVDSTHLNSFLWAVTPTLMIIGVLDLPFLNKKYKI